MGAHERHRGEAEPEEVGQDDREDQLNRVAPAECGRERHARAALTPTAPRVCAAAIVLSTDRPIAPPMRRDVFSRPLATPLRGPSTPCIATIVAGTSVKPIPSDVSTPPTSTMPAHELCGAT